MRTIFRRTAAAAPPVLDLYDIAYLAGGPRRVAETAVIALSERGAITVRRSRARVTGGRAEHPVERALIALCPVGKRVAPVLTALRDGPETARIGQRLVSYGLLARSRRRLTPAGRRHLETARAEGTLPGYVFTGPAAVPDRGLRRTLREAAPPPSGLGRGLIRMGRTLESDSDSYAYSDAYCEAYSDSASTSCHDGGGGHHSCGGGGGGGGGGGSD
ncbi:TIGR04222 domain-containing membrane protein [Streptomyces sp. NPDC005271]|uniref:TIGR04222 domain-containing membrane protein n=1 Tax=unclassified Streptomyces TaxID=2593676 RepID=UPI0033B91A40